MELTLSKITSITVSAQKGGDADPYRIVTMQDKDGKEYIVYIFGVPNKELDVFFK